jgi:hypothetical protein
MISPHHPLDCPVCLRLPVHAAVTQVRTAMERVEYRIDSCGSVTSHSLSSLTGRCTRGRRRDELLLPLPPPPAPPGSAPAAPARQARQCRAVPGSRRLGHHAAQPRQMHPSPHGPLPAPLLRVRARSERWRTRRRALGGAGTARRKTDPANRFVGCVGDSCSRKWGLLSDRVARRPGSLDCRFLAPRLRAGSASTIAATQTTRDRHDRPRQPLAAVVCATGTVDPPPPSPPPLPLVQVLTALPSTGSSASSQGL